MVLKDDLDIAINASNGRGIVSRPHWTSKADRWTIAGFRADEINFKKTQIIDEMNKWQEELRFDLENNKKTTVLPTYLTNVDNILTLIGLTESAKRDTNESATTLSHASIGTDSTAATQNDTDLGAEDSGGSYARLAFDTAGQRKVINQTAQYGIVWDDADISTTPLSVKEAGIHWDVSAASKMHARVTFTTFSFDPGDLLVVRINELMENG